MGFQLEDRVEALAAYFAHETLLVGLALVYLFDVRYEVALDEEGLAAVVTADKHLVIRDEVTDSHNDVNDTDLLKRLAVTSGIGQGNVQLRPDREHAPLVQQGPVTLYPGRHLMKMRIKGIFVELGRFKVIASFLNS